MKTPLVLKLSQSNYYHHKRIAVAAFAALATIGMPGLLNAQAADDEVIEEVVTLGSRVPGRVSSDLPVPVDTLSADEMSATGQTEVGRMLQTLAPSFNFSSSSISDGTDALRPATLRGLGPDQTLVLINGKRRHQASLIHINTSVGRGTAGTDMNAIPAASIKRIEVLRDGAAAQYGSDAIAGVINIILKDDPDEGYFGFSQGEYTEGDGATTNVDFSKGFALGDSGYLNATFNYRDRDYTNRAGLHGSCQFPGCADTNDNGIVEAGDPREVTAPRDTFRIGDAISQQFATTLNAAFQVGEGELYGFVTYSQRENESAAFFRHNGNTGGNAPLPDGDATIPPGFLPKIRSDIQDLSYDFGYRIEFDNDATMDLSYTKGTNTIDYVTGDSLNSSFANTLIHTTNLTSDEIRSSVPREANAYGLELSLQTINLDFTQSFGDVFFAMGAQMRTDEYKVIAGDEYSYRDYDTVNGVNLYPVDCNEDDAIDCVSRSGGIQGFGGIGPQSAVDETRDVFSVYADAEYSFTDNFMVGGAVRYDNYDGFGDTINVKLATNIGITDSVSIRGSASTGFRAPSMQQLYFNNLSTQFRLDDAGELVAFEVGTFRNDSLLAQAIGIPELKEEESVNFSLGIVADITDNLNLTVDYYAINIDDRIVLSNSLGTGLTDALDAALALTGAGGGQFFLNGADTETTGIDIIATWGGFQLLGGDFNFTFAANFTDTEVTDLFTPVDSGLETIPGEEVFSPVDVSIIEEWQPQDRVSLITAYTNGGWRFNLAFNRYGEYTVSESATSTQTYGAKVLTDINLSYAFNNGIAVNLAGNNIFDVTPDKNLIGQSRTGAIEDGPGGPIIVDSAGVFDFSRRSAPFGFNGAYISAGVSWNF
jgi:iron complex outermembrane receptor protein